MLFVCVIKYSCSIVYNGLYAMMGLSYNSKGELFGLPSAEVRRFTPSVPSRAYDAVEPETSQS